jgi:trk system potassium uptake protein TrkH
MNWRLVIRIQWFVLLVLGMLMSFPLFWSIYYQGDDIYENAVAMSITLVVGMFIAVVFRSPNKLGVREGFCIVTLGWSVAALFGALPLYLSGEFGNYIDCVFEAMSGLTTTGATILRQIEGLPKGVLFWRSLLHWLGGMGIILLTIVILPALDVSYGQLYRAEVPGPTKDRIRPRIQDTAKILWFIYLGLTLLETLLLMIGGMSLYDALCHTFGTLATGGFSTRNASIAAFKSVYIEVVIMLFMYLAGINFALHFQLIRGRVFEFFKNREWQFYTAVLLVSIVIVSLNLFLSSTPQLVSYKQYSKALRDAAFQVVSITTTTGFCTANFDLWPSLSKLLLVCLMFFGGCAGSTGGGMKQVRIIIVFKQVWREIRRLMHPRAVFKIRLGLESVPDYVIRNVTAFVLVFIGLFVFVTLFLALRGYDMVTCFSASIATLGNIGPGLAKVGAIENYAFFDPYSKIVLTIAMMLGRLEIFSVLIFFANFFDRH